MTERAEGAITVDHRDETPAAWEGGAVTRARWTKVFTGEVAGTSVIEFIMGTLDPDGRGQTPRVYLGVERFEGTVQGRKGTFVIVHSATAYGEDHHPSWTILTGSGTGELAGITGTAQILPNHDFVLEYDLSD